MIDKLIEEIEELQEAKDLLESLYINIGPYNFRQLIREHFPDYDSTKTISRLERFFDFDDSE